MELQFGTSSFVRDSGNFPYLPVINMFAEDVSTEPTRALISRPGLTSSKGMPGGEIRALYQQDGVLNGALFGISDDLVYQNETQIGKINGDLTASIVGYKDRVFFNAGLSIAQWDGSEYSIVGVPGGAFVSKIVVGASRLIAICRDSQQFYWSDVLSSNIDALSFASAESSPDNLIDAVFLGGRLMLFGSRTVETWAINNDPDLPFAPLQGATFSAGIKNQGAVSTMGSSFVWVTDNNRICVGNPETIISFPGLEAKLADTKSVRVWNFFIDGKEFVAFQFDNESWIWKVDTQTWSQFESTGQERWEGNCYANGYIGGIDSGRVMVWSDTYLDTSSYSLERRFRAWAPITGSSVTVDNVIARFNSGYMNLTEGLYPDTFLEMRTSRDGGNTWTKWQKRSLGKQGKFRNQIYWNGVGFFTFPGMLIEIRTTDPVPFRVSSLVINEEVGFS